MDIKNQKIVDYIIKIVTIMDDTLTNANRYKNFFKNMTDKEFDKYMKLLRAGEVQIYMTFPNMKIPMKMENFLKAAKVSNTKIFQKLIKFDDDTGKKYLTGEEYPVFNVPIRQLQQYIDKKMSVPDGDSKIDSLTGQVVAQDKAASITNPEIQLLSAMGLSETLKELIKVRGGDVHAYSEFKRQMEETGMAELSRLSPSITKSVVTTEALMRGMGLDSNFVEGVS